MYLLIVSILTIHLFSRNTLPSSFIQLKNMRILIYTSLFILEVSFNSVIKYNKIYSIEIIYTHDKFRKIIGLDCTLAQIFKA